MHILGKQEVILKKETDQCGMLFFLADQLLMLCSYLLQKESESLFCLE